MPRTRSVLDVSAPLCRLPLAAGVLDEKATLEAALRVTLLPTWSAFDVSLVLAAPEQGCCLCDLGPSVGVTEATLSHRRQLRDAGLIVGTRRGTMTWYRPVPDSLAALCRVIDPDCCP